MTINRRSFLGAAGAAALATSSSAAQAPEKPERVAQPGQTKNTKFAVNIEMWFSKLPFLQRIEKCADMGFPAVEFWPWERRDISAIAEVCKRRNIEIAQFSAW